MTRRRQRGLGLFDGSRGRRHSLLGDVDEDAAICGGVLFGVVTEYLDVVEPRDVEHRQELVSEIQPLEKDVFLLLEDLAVSPEQRTDLAGCDLVKGVKSRQATSELDLIAVLGTFSPADRWPRFRQPLSLFLDPVTPLVRVLVGEVVIQEKGSAGL